MTGLSRRAYLAGVGAAVGLAGCLGGSGGETSDAPTVETIAVADLDGGPVPARPAGEPALVDFFGTWCAPCKPQMAELRAVGSRFPDLHMVSVTQETDAEAIRRFWREYEGTWPVGSDPGLQVFQHFGVRNVPTKVLVDDTGERVWRHSGLAAADTIAREVEAVV
jgi:thiol-disulfide isomerase/thioredoxin